MKVYLSVNHNIPPFFIWERKILSLRINMQRRKFTMTMQEWKDRKETKDKIPKQERNDKKETKDEIPDQARNDDEKNGMTEKKERKG
jgi:hypothetical protein